MLEIITAGMYSDPRMIYREFAQNAADSIDLAREVGLLDAGDGRVDITIDGEKRLIRVEDNGTGIPNGQVDERLGSLGNSVKEGSLQRGFRGIGRLGGLAHCALLQFETRSSDKEEVAVVEWDGRALRNTMAHGIAKRESLSEVVQRIARVSYRSPYKHDPAHFFRATMQDVHRFHADLLMNVEAVVSYLSQEAPVPFESTFSFREQLNDYLSGLPGFRAYDVRVNGRTVRRPYSDIFEINESVSDRIKGVETFEFKAVDGSLLARGWFARTSLLASLPRRCAMRGIRIRQGNISIGDEYLLEDVFSERRFATWHIGSIEVNQQLRPNARRDGFEETPAYERFLEQAALLGRHLSRQCRTESKLRVSRSSLDRKLTQAESTLKVEFFLDEEHKDVTVRQFRKQLDDLMSVSQKGGADGDFESRLKALTRKLAKVQGETPFLESKLDGRKLQRLDPQELLRRVCRTIIDARPDGDHNHRIMRQVVDPFLKTSA